MILKKQLLGNLLAPLRVRDFCLLFVGQMISTIGDMFYAVALPWLMLSSGHTPQELGIVLATYGVPRVGTLLLGGLLSDWLRPRRVMLLADIMRALLVGVLAVLVFTGRTAVLPLCAVAAPLGAFAGLFLPAYYAVLPEILGADALQAGNALNTSSLQLALLIGSGLAGLVVSRLQSGPAFVVDALTFVVSALTLILMRGEHRSAEAVTAQQEQALAQEASGGEATFAQDITFWRLLQVAFLVIIFGNFLFNGLFEVALPTLARDQFVSGAGGLPGAALLIGCAGLTNGMLTVLAFTVMQQQAPPHLLGRLLGIFLFASLGLYPLSVALVGVVSSHVGPVILFPISGAMMLGAAAFGWLQRDIRKL